MNWWFTSSRTSFDVALDVFLVVVFVVFGSGLAMAVAAAASRFAAFAVLIRPLLRGMRREIINLDLTNLSFLGGTLFQRLGWLVKWSNTATHWCKTPNNNLFLSTSFTPKNIHARFKQPYLHSVHTLIHVIRRTGNTLKGILSSTFRDSYQKKIRWFTHFDGFMVKLAR